MNKTIFTILACFGLMPVFASDVLTLSNDSTFEGKVRKIKNCFVFFETNENVYKIPASDVYCLEFGDVNDPVYLDYMNLLENDPNACLNGSLDAESYHGQKGAHFALGILFGPFAIIGTALSNPTPMKGKETMMMSNHKEQFSDPAYLNCYKKKAKGQMIGMEALGWGTWILLALVL